MNLRSCMLGLLHRRISGRCMLSHFWLLVACRRNRLLPDWRSRFTHRLISLWPVLQIETDRRFFSFVVKTEFDGTHRFDQCGVAVYLDSENWLKASTEYENDSVQHLGSVVTNGGFSDWATVEIPASVKTMWYRLSRRNNDFRIENSFDGRVFKQMRICHLNKANDKIRFGIYACSPEESSFTAIFTNMEILECQWKAHDGQQPD